MKVEREDIGIGLSQKGSTHKIAFINQGLYSMKDTDVFETIELENYEQNSMGICNLG